MQGPRIKLQENSHLLDYFSDWNLNVTKSDKSRILFNKDVLAAVAVVVVKDPFCSVFEVLGSLFL